MGTTIDISQEITAQERRIDVFLQPGEQYWGDRNSRIWTVLGSCVSVCLHNTELKIGGMNHILLPGSAPENKRDPAFPARYADQAMSLMAKEIAHLGLKPQSFVAKVFGGGNRIKESQEKSVGERNFQSVLESLRDMGISVVAEDHGGTDHRKIIFDIEEGKVWVKKYQAKQ